MTILFYVVGKAIIIRRKKIMKVKMEFAFLLSLICLFCGISIPVFAANTSEIESNNTYAEANDFAINSSVSGKMNKSGDKDYYKITVPKNGKLTITFEHLYTSDHSNWGINVYQYINGAYVNVLPRVVYGTDNESISFSHIGAVASGIYYIVVSMNPYVEGAIGKDYTLKNTFTPTENYEKELNDSYQTATNINLNQTISGNMRTGSDIDFYKISTNKGLLTVNFGHTYCDGTSVRWIAEIYQYGNGEYKNLVSKKIYGKDNENVKLQSVQMDGKSVYYVKISTSTDAYMANSIGREYAITCTLEEKTPQEVTTIKPPVTQPSETTKVYTTQPNSTTTTISADETTTVTEVTNTTFESILLTQEENNNKNISESSIQNNSHIKNKKSNKNTDKNQSRIVIIIVAVIVVWSIAAIVVGSILISKRHKKIGK